MITKIIFKSKKSRIIQHSLWYTIPIAFINIVLFISVICVDNKENVCDTRTITLFVVLYILILIFCILQYIFFKEIDDQKYDKI